MSELTTTTSPPCYEPMTPATSNLVLVRTTEELASHVRVLAALPESDAPVLSCYLDIEAGREAWESMLEHRVALLQRIARGERSSTLRRLWIGFARFSPQDYTETRAV